MIRVARYTITATSLSPIRIGGREDPLSEADNPVAVVGGRVCVPGPSLKGALRNELERHLNDEFYDTRSGRWPSAELANATLHSVHPSFA
jgi:CRISPR/Cas system CSM-associated protein Csm3 (group 7 of RAMP superfamily)